MLFRSKFELVKAETINGQLATPVPNDMIEDQPSAGDTTAFDRQNQVKVAFPRVGIGSKVHLAYAMKNFKVAFPGTFAERLSFGAEGYERGSVSTFDSELPLYYAVTDPTKSLEVTSSERNGHYFVEIKLTKPIYTAVLDEPQSYHGDLPLTEVVVSTAKTYAPFAMAVMKDYEAVLGAPLPPPYERILTKAKAAKTLEGKINVVVSGLQEELRYMGDWRTVAGEMVPRPLTQASESRFGDCKDFSAATVALLRRLGVVAHVAWVERQDVAMPLPKLPLLFSNHAIEIGRAHV